MGSRRTRVAFIPVRGGSKSIPQKNIKNIGGKPLVFWVIDAALESKVFDDIYISTDDHQIADVIGTHPQAGCLTIVKRSKETATDTASTESAMLEFARQYDFDVITLLQATSPLITGQDIARSMDLFDNDRDADSLLSVCREKRFIWEKTNSGFSRPVNYDPANRPRRQEFDGFLVENGALYITGKNQLLESQNRISGKVMTFEMSPETYFELDEPSDWVIIENLLKQEKKSEYKPKLKEIRLFLVDVDGVLTDAGMYYSETGDELKKFNTKDGKGIELLKKQGIEVGIITSEDTRIVADRAKKLKVDILYQGIKDKGSILDEILSELTLSPHQVAYIGDDLNDLSIIRRVGFSAAPADAVNKIKLEVDYVCSKKGGRGCVREIADLILSEKIHKQKTYSAS